MMERSHPSDLAAHVRARWPAEARPLPTKLEALLDVAYHASFLRDEERDVTFRIAALSPSELPADGGPPATLLPLVFEAPRSYDEQELRRLSPAADIHRALIGINDGDVGLAIWGVVQSGPRWLQAAQGGRAKEPPVPPCLVVRAVRPGHLVVSCGSRLIAELRGGRLSDFTLDVFQSRWLPALFADARMRMVSEHRASFPDSLLDDGVAAQLTGHLAQQMLKRVVATMRSTHHGGTLLVGPPECIADRYLQTTYQFADGPSRRRFRSLVLEILAAVAERAISINQRASVDIYRLTPDPILAELDEALFEISNLIAALTRVDGAVVLTKRFEILGFGAEIAGELPVVHVVRRALDLEGETFASEVVDSVGTRHRSAYRLCAAVPEAVAVVVSQDGGVRFVAHHRGAVTYWDQGLGDG